ncbi:MAG TPA: hypothetical protein VIH59_22850 [Candidatus Tectomicrobia bacterium]|jgi:hypothetical protein
MQVRRYAQTFSLLLLLMHPMLAAAANPDPNADLRPTMHAIFQALTTVFPLSLQRRQFQDTAQRPRIRDALRQLADHAEQLANHGQQIPPHFDFLRQSLQQNARYALRRFEDGETEEARFIVQQLTDHCFLCHSRVPSAQAFPLGQRFLASMSSEDLTLPERVRLAVAARQFDAALSICETLFRSLDIPAAQIDLMALFEDYLRLAIRVRDDRTRVIQTFAAFQQRPDVPAYLAEHLTSWITTLHTWQPDPAADDLLAQAGALIRRGQQQNRFLADRQGLVHFILASRLLHRYVSDNARPALQLAEAYYLLGVAESYIPRSSWISETEFFLEMAVRLAPTSPHAKKAYAFLEEYVITGYTGTMGLHLPSDVQDHLDELRRLLHGS